MHNATDGRVAGTKARGADETADAYRARLDRVRTDRRNVADRLARLYAMLEDRDVAPPVIVVLGSGFVSADWTCEDADTFRSVVKAVGSTVDNPWNKQTANGSYRLTQNRDGIAFEVRAGWVTCDQVQTGVAVKETTEVIEPAKTRTVVNEVPVYEWRCPDSVLFDGLTAGQQVAEPAAEIAAG